MENKVKTYSGLTPGVLGKTIKGEYVRKNCEHYILSIDGVYNLVIENTVKELKKKKNDSNK
jgi:hypothetical protein